MVVLIVLCLGVKIVVLFAPYSSNMVIQTYMYVVFFIFLVKFGYLSGHLLGK